MEPAWSLSTHAPADPSKSRRGPEMRRRDADLLFRGYSSPVDKKTIELSCWNRRGHTRRVNRGESATILLMLRAASCFLDRFDVLARDKQTALFALEASLTFRESK